MVDKCSKTACRHASYCDDRATASVWWKYGLSYGFAHSTRLSRVDDIPSSALTIMV